MPMVDLPTEPARQVATPALQVVDTVPESVAWAHADAHAVVGGRQEPRGAAPAMRDVCGDPGQRLAGAQPAVGDRPDSRPAQAADRMADGFEHPSVRKTIAISEAAGEVETATSCELSNFFGLGGAAEYTTKCAAGPPVTAGF